MKKACFTLIIASLCFSFSCRANPGDTTWVQANATQMPGYGNYDTTVYFPHPGKTYRKIYMIYTLGKYVCGGSGYCGDWDYTVDNYVMTPRGDTFNLGRFITPYANAGAPRTPWAWKQHYIFDVTDYARVLYDSATIRIGYSGYTGGFTANIKFAFIEGVPDRNVVGMNRLWHGYWSYGDTTHSDSNNINVHFPYMNFTAPAGTQSSELKFTVTGHGSDASFCNEFCSHNYYVYLDSALVDSYTIWRPDCGKNELFPQSGTWIYERANWCPGAIVYSEHHKLPGITAGAGTNVDIQFSNYIGNGGAGYGAEGALFFYGPLNKTLDVSLDQIIAPTNDENHFRENPVTGNPVVHVKNTGATPVNSILFNYGIVDSPVQSFLWVGTLNSLAETDIYLPPGLYQLNNIAGTTGTYNFYANITAVNGTADDDSTNNAMTSQFTAAPKWPSKIQIWMKTNNEFASTDSNICETSWAIYDMYDNIFAKRANAALSTLYLDTISFPSTGGYYKLVIYDSSCDGLNWWANAGTGITSGYLVVKQITGANLQLHGYQYSGTYNNDFGCGLTQYFSVGNLVQNSISNINEDNIAITAYPNPAQNMVNVEISGMQRVKGTLQVIDALGRVVSLIPCNSALKPVNTSGLSSGVYTIGFIDELQQNKRLTTRLLIVK